MVKSRGPRKISVCNKFAQPSPGTTPMSTKQGRKSEKIISWMHNMQNVALSPYIIIVPPFHHHMKHTCKKHKQLLTNLSEPNSFNLTCQRKLKPETYKST